MPLTVRVKPETVQAWLNQLDGLAREPDGLDRRFARRFAYRQQDLNIELPRPQSESLRPAVIGRNISRLGIGLLAEQFVYPGAECRVTLTSPYGRTDTVAGKIARCRYLVGSAALHEIGVRFDRPIDVAVYAPEARLIRILLLDDAESTKALITRFLKSMHVEIIGVTTLLRAIHAINAADFDLVLVNLEPETFDAFAAVGDLRKTGYIGPIIGMAVQDDAAIRKWCEEAGCTGYITKPITRDELHVLIDSLVERPLFSTLTDDPDIAPLIDEFVDRLRGAVSSINALVEARDRATLRSIARKLMSEAGSYGFDPITESATYLQALLDSGSPDHQVNLAAQELMHLCLRARPANSPPEPTPHVQDIEDASWSRILSTLGEPEHAIFDDDDDDLDDAS